MVRQDNFVPSRRFREDGLDPLKLPELILLELPPWRNKRSLVTLCRSKWSPWYLYPKESKTTQKLEANRHAYRVTRKEANPG